MNDGKEEMENVGSGEKEDQPCSEATMGSISQGQQFGGGKTWATSGCGVGQQSVHEHDGPGIRGCEAADGRGLEGGQENAAVAIVASGWPTLPEAIRAGIVAMVKAPR